MADLSARIAAHPVAVAMEEYQEAIADGCRRAPPSTPPSNRGLPLHLHGGGRRARPDRTSGPHRRLLLVPGGPDRLHRRSTAGRLALRDLRGPGMTTATRGRRSTDGAPVQIHAAPDDLHDPALRAALAQLADLKEFR